MGYLNNENGRLTSVAESQLSDRREDGIYLEQGGPLVGLSSDSCIRKQHNLVVNSCCLGNRRRSASRLYVRLSV